MRLFSAAVAASILMLAVTTAAVAQGSVVDVAMQQSPDELMKGIETQHPAAYYILAMKLFDADRKDEATFWFYAGQLRYRFHLAAHPDLDPSGDPALFESLSDLVGRAVNEYAFGDLEVLDATLEKVKAWDEENSNGFTSKIEYAAEWKTTRNGMEELIKYIRANGEQIRSQRKANGLENRN
ncbi:MAG: hypothetical protein NDJ92_16595 [Thermoanaerobaculia bacterium]|nr:hypothetical protein [Thermoanaerobaculia bacterium]